MMPGDKEQKHTFASATRQLPRGNHEEKSLRLIKDNKNIFESQEQDKERTQICWYNVRQDVRYILI